MHPFPPNLAILVSFVLATADVGAQWQVEEGFRWSELPVRANGKPGFTQLPAAETGLDFSNDVSREESTSRMLIMDGSGVALGDVDRDGLCDIFVASLAKSCRLFRNLGGWKFKDITGESGLGAITGPGSFAKGACLADLDGDGHLDIVVTFFLAEPKVKAGGVRCFLGDGSGHFKEVTDVSGLESNAGSHSVALADVDGDGDLDLYVANYRDLTIRDANLALTGSDASGARYSIRRSYDHREKLIEELRFPIAFGHLTVPAGQRDRFLIDGEDNIIELGLPDVLYLNDGHAKFTPVSWTGGAFRDEDGKPLDQPPRDFGLAATFRDFNNDGVPDLYVCNDFETPDRFWLGDGKGGFQAAPRLALRNMSSTSMGVDVGDVNRDGQPDFFVVDMLARAHERQMRQGKSRKTELRRIGEIDNRPEVGRNTLHLGRGDGTWAEIASLAGVAASEWSWQPVFLDVDFDGWEDLFITNGFERDTLDSDSAAQMQSMKMATVRERSAALQQLYEPLAPPNVAFRNRGDLTFEEVGAKWGLDTPGIAHGVAEADLDGDGDLDLVVNMYRAPLAVYRNNGSAPRVNVRLHGKSPNWQGIGGKVTLRGGAVPMQSREVFCGGRYLSGGDPALCFAAGKAKGGMSLEVQWRSGAHTVLKNVQPNRVYEISEP